MCRYVLRWACLAKVVQGIGLPPETMHDLWVHLSRRNALQCAGVGEHLAAVVTELPVKPPPPLRVPSSFVVLHADTARASNAIATRGVARTERSAMERSGAALWLWRAEGSCVVGNDV